MQALTFFTLLEGQISVKIPSEDGQALVEVVRRVAGTDSSYFGDMALTGEHETIQSRSASIFATVKAVCAELHRDDFFKLLEEIRAEYLGETGGAKREHGEIVEEGDGPTLTSTQNEEEAHLGIWTEDELQKLLDIELTEEDLERREERIKEAVQRNLERSRAIARKRQEELDRVFAQHHRRSDAGASEHEDENNGGGTESSISGTNSGKTSQYQVQRNWSSQRRRSSRLLRLRRSRSRRLSSFDGEDLQEGQEGRVDGSKGRHQRADTGGGGSSHKFFPRFINANPPTDVKLFWCVPLFLFLFCSCCCCSVTLTTIRNLIAISIYPPNRQGRVHLIPRDGKIRRQARATAWQGA